MSDARSANHSRDAAAWLQRLREERERRGLGRQQVADDLHVDMQIIEALEAGRFASLGAPVFARGYLRKYAELLGLDAGELVSAFERESAEPPALVPITRAAPRRPEVPMNWLGGAVVAAIVLGVAWWALTEREKPVERVVQTPGTPAPRAVEPVVAGPKPRQTQPSTAAEPVVAEPAPREIVQSAIVEAVSGTPVELQLNFSADSWVELYDAGGQRVFFDLGAANSVRSFRVLAPLRVFLGFADGVELELDGRAVTLPAEVRHGNVARFTVDAHGHVRPARG